jgi:hypothetical protein
MQAHGEGAARGYREISAAGKLHLQSGAWAFFMREVVRLPPDYNHAVSQSLRLGNWQIADDPIQIVREEALEAYHRAWRKRA